MRVSDILNLEYARAQRVGNAASAPAGIFLYRNNTRKKNERIVKFIVK